MKYEFSRVEFQTAVAKPTIYTTEFIYVRI